MVTEEPWFMALQLCLPQLTTRKIVNHFVGIAQGIGDHPDSVVGKNITPSQRDLWIRHRS